MAKTDIFSCKQQAIGQGLLLKGFLTDKEGTVYNVYEETALADEELPL